MSDSNCQTFFIWWVTKNVLSLYSTNNKITTNKYDKSEQFNNRREYYL